MMTGQPTPKIRIKGLKKAFGGQAVLAGLDLDIRAGDHLVLLGISGSGKTVLVKCILGLIDADAGSILIDGEETINRPPAAREHIMRKIGVLFQNGALFDSLPVWQNSHSAWLIGVVWTGTRQDSSQHRRRAAAVARNRFPA